MKLALSLLGLAGTASAFAPSTVGSANTALRMSDEAAAAPEPEVPLMTKADTVPCFGATPLIGEPVFFGENWWNKITTEWGSADTGTFVRAAEIKHGRSAMIATVGYAIHKLGFTMDSISPHEYLSVTQGIKFADLAAMTPPEAMKSLPAESWGQMFAAIALVEIYELSHKDGKVAYDETVAPGLQPGGLTGDLGWNPLDIAVTDRRRLVEIQNGRAAMVAICGFIAADTIPGSFPVPLLW